MQNLWCQHLLVELEMSMDIFCQSRKGVYFLLKTSTNCMCDAMNFRWAFLQLEQKNKRICCQLVPNKFENKIGQKITATFHFSPNCNFVDGDCLNFPSGLVLKLKSQLVQLYIIKHESCPLIGFCLLTKIWTCVNNCLSVSRHCAQVKNNNYIRKCNLDI